MKQGETIMFEILQENGWEYYIKNNEAYIVGVPDAEKTTLFVPKSIGGYPIVKIDFYMAPMYGYDSVHLSKNIKFFDASCVRENIANIRVDEENEYFAARDGILYSKDFKTIISFPPSKKDFNDSCLDGVEIIGESAFDSCDSLISVNIPTSVVEIGTNAFSFSERLKSVEMFDSVKKIGAGAFGGCGLENIVLSRNINKLECSEYSDDYLGFFSCADFVEFNIPDNIEIIGDQTFENCEKLKKIYIPASVREIGEYVFHGCSALEEIIVSKDNKFYYSDDGVLYSREGTLLYYPQNKKENFFTVPDNIIKINAYAFCANNNLKKLMLGNDVSEIGRSAFSYSHIETINIPKSLRAIEKNVFLCSSIKELYIPKSVLYVEMNSDTVGDVNPFRDILILVDKGSYAEGMCIEYGLKYKIINN